MRNKVMKKVLAINGGTYYYNELLEAGVSECVGCTEDGQYFKFRSKPEYEDGGMHKGYPKRYDLALGFLDERMRTDVFLTADELKEFVLRRVLYSLSNPPEYYIVYDESETNKSGKTYLLAAKQIKDAFTGKIMYKTNRFNNPLPAFGSSYTVYNNLEDAIAKLIQIFSPYFIDKNSESESETPERLTTNISLKSDEIEALASATGFEIKTDEALKKAIYSLLGQATAYKMGQTG